MSCTISEGKIPDKNTEGRDLWEEQMEKENIALAENIKNLMKNMNWTAEQAMEAMGLGRKRSRP